MFLHSPRALASIRVLGGVLAPAKERLAALRNATYTCALRLMASESKSLVTAAGTQCSYLSHLAGSARRSKVPQLCSCTDVSSLPPVPSASLLRFGRFSSLRPSGSKPPYDS